MRMRSWCSTGINTRTQDKSVPYLAFNNRWARIVVPVQKFIAFLLLVYLLVCRG